MLENKLKKLIENATREQQENVIHGIASFYYDSFPKLSKFVMRKLANPLLKNRNARIIVDHFDEILPLINMTNMDILLIHAKSLVKYQNFKEKFIAGLKKYPYIDCAYELIYTIYCSLNDSDKYNDFVDKDILEVLSSMDLGRKDLIDLLNDANEENQRIFLQLLCKNKANIPYEGIDYKGDNIQIIYDNLPLYIENAKNLYYLMYFVRSNPEALSMVKEYIDNNEEQAIESIFCETKDMVKIVDPDLRTFITQLIKEIVDVEGVKYSEITYNGGGFSRVVLIGDKVLKLGERFTKSFPNNPYIVAPLLRQEVKIGDESCFIEVTERVDTSEEPSMEELYQLYKKLRELGLIWTDIKPMNVGRLRKDNIIHWSEELTPSDDVLGLGQRRGLTTLKEGDWVILDADFIFDENDPNINYTDKRYVCADFEERYQKERKKALYSPSNEHVESNEMSEERSGRGL